MQTSFATLDKEKGIPEPPPASGEEYPLPVWYRSIRDVPLNKLGIEVEPGQIGIRWFWRVVNQDGGDVEALQNLADDTPEKTGGFVLLEHVAIGR